MSQSLLKISDDMDALFDLVGQEGGELNAITEAWLAEVESNLSSKTDNYDRVLERTKGESNRLKEKAAQFLAAAKALDNLEDRLKDTIKYVMLAKGLDEIKGRDVRFKLSKSQPSLVITHEQSIPKEFCIIKTIVELDKSRIKEVLKSGETVPGAELKESFSLRKYVNKGV